LIAPGGPGECPYVGLEPFGPGHADYFFGRGRDSRIIADHVLNRRVIVLYGASGTGKSSVLNVGLPRALLAAALKAGGTGRAREPPRKSAKPPITVVLREWQDPEQLEQRAVDAVFAALSSEEREALPRHMQRADRVRFAPLVARVIHSAGCALLLILDQFEEYFLYRDVTRERSIEVAMARLVARRDTPFHLLLSLRDDSLHRLDELRALVPGILDTTLKLEHLSDLGVKEAIEDPLKVYNHRFRAKAPIVLDDALVPMLTEQLKKAEIGLAKGDAATATERPIELSYLQLALTKLWTAEGGAQANALRAATLTDPNKLGGVERIVRDHVNGVMNGLDNDEQRLCARIFDRLVTGIGSKIAYPTKGLAAAEGVPENLVEAVLEKLTPKESRILRRVTTSNGLQGYELFHDVLGMPVLEWTRAFQAKARREEEVAAALADEANQRQQERLRRTKIAAAAFGGLGLIAVGAAAWALSESQRATAEATRAREQRLVAEQQRVRADRQAANAEQERAAAQQQEALANQERDRANFQAGKSLWASFSFEGAELTQDELDTLWQIVRASGPLRNGFLEPLASRPAKASVVVTFGKRPEPIIRALGLEWLSSDQPARTLDNVLELGGRIVEPQALRAWARALSSLTGTLSESESEAALSPMLLAIDRAIKRAGIDQASSGEVRVPRSLGRPRPAQPEDEQGENNRLQDLTALAEALTALPATVRSDGMPAVLAAVLKLSTLKASEDEISALAEAAKALAWRLDATQAHAQLELLLEEFRKASKPGHIEVLTKVLEGLPPVTLRDEQARSMFTVILQALTKDKSPVSELSDAANNLAARLTPKQALAAFGPSLQALVRKGDQKDDPELAETVKTLASRLTPEEAPAALDAIFQMLANSSVKTSEVLGTSIALMARKLSPEQARAKLVPLLGLFSKATDPLVMLALAQALGNLSGTLTAAQARDAVGAIGKGLEARRSASPPEAFQRRMLVQAARALASKLSPEHRQELLGVIVKNLSSDSIRPPSLLEAVQGLAASIPEQSVKEVLDSATQGSSALRTRVSIVAALGRRLPPETAQAELARLLETVSLAKGAAWVWPAAPAIQALAANATADQAKAASDLLLEAIKANTTPFLLSIVTSALAALRVTLTREQTQPLLDSVLRQLTSPRDYFDLVRALEAIAPMLTSEQAQMALRILPLSRQVPPYRVRAVNGVARALATTASTGEIAGPLAWAGEQLRSARLEHHAHLLATIIVTLVSQQPDHKFLAVITDTLKYPTAAGSPTKVLLEALRQRFPAAPATERLADIVAWLKPQVGPEVLTRPPP
jgi:hypothetical protein